MANCTEDVKAKLVAPLAGSVDRNLKVSTVDTPPGKSLPSRGAWIEMTTGSGCTSRNKRRSPRGERG